MRNKKIALGGIAAVAVVGFAGTAMTASSDIPGSVAGYGSAAVSGADVQSVVHTLSTTGEGSTIDATTVEFSTALVAGTYEVKARFGDGTYTDCTLNGLTGATCNWTGVTTASANEFSMTVRNVTPPQV